MDNLGLSYIDYLNNSPIAPPKISSANTRSSAAPGPLTFRTTATSNITVLTPGEASYTKVGNVVQLSAAFLVYCNDTGFTLTFDQFSPSNITPAPVAIANSNVPGGCTISQNLGQSANLMYTRLAQTGSTLFFQSISGNGYTGAVQLSFVCQYLANQ